MVAAEVAAKEKKVNMKTAAIENNETVFESTPVARKTAAVTRTDAETAFQLSPGHLKQKWAPLGRGVRGRQFTFDS